MKKPLWLELPNRINETLMLDISLFPVAMLIPSDEPECKCRVIFSDGSYCDTKESQVEVKKKLDKLYAESKKEKLQEGWYCSSCDEIFSDDTIHFGEDCPKCPKCNRGSTWNDK